MYAFFHSYNI